MFRFFDSLKTEGDTASDLRMLQRLWRPHF